MKTDIKCTFMSQFFFCKHYVWYFLLIQNVVFIKRPQLMKLSSIICVRNLHCTHMDGNSRMITCCGLADCCCFHSSHVVVFSLLPVDCCCFRHIISFFSPLSLVNGCCFRHYHVLTACYRSYKCCSWSLSVDYCCFVALFMFFPAGWIATFFGHLWLFFSPIDCCHFLLFLVTCYFFSSLPVDYCHFCHCSCCCCFKIATSCLFSVAAGWLLPRLSLPVECCLFCKCFFPPLVDCYFCCRRLIVASLPCPIAVKVFLRRHLSPRIRTRRVASGCKGR